MPLNSLDGKFIDCNPFFQKFIGYSKEELLKMAIKDITHPDDLEESKNQFMQLANGKLPFLHLQKRYIKKNGEEVWGITSAMIIRDHESNPLYAFAMIQDITPKVIAEKKLKELNEKLEDTVKKRTIELENLNKELELFAYAASHDLQEPLRTIIGFNNLIKKRTESNLDAQTKRFMDIVSATVNRMQTQITDLLNFSRIEKDSMQCTNINCTDIIKHISNDLKSVIDENKAKIIADSLPQIKGYDTLIRLLFQNLISNAVKFSKPGINPKIKISSSNLKNYWKFEVKDNGIGVDQQYFNQIFNAFKRLHTKDEYSGTGLGLASCMKIVNKHNGKIWLKSTPNKGSSFYFTIAKNIDDHG